MKEKIRIICGSSWEDMELAIKFTSQPNMERVNSNDTILPIEMGIKFYVKINPNLSIDTYYYDSEYLYVINKNIWR
jgi:hypothetical protein